MYYHLFEFSAMKSYHFHLFFFFKEMLPTLSLSMLLFAFWYLHIMELLESGIYDLQSVAVSIAF